MLNMESIEQRGTVLGLRMDRKGQISIGPVQPRKAVHLERWTDFSETFPVEPSRSIQFWLNRSRSIPNPVRFQA